MAARIIALVGAESTGKSTLARQLADALRADGLVVAAAVADAGIVQRKACG